MSAVPFKIHSLLKFLKESEKPVATSTITLRPANTPMREKTFAITSKNDIHILAGEVKAARLRLEDIHSRLEMSLKAGLANNTVH